jgi:D-amino-acid dehydrogenase
MTTAAKGVTAAAAGVGAWTYHRYDQVIHREQQLPTHRLNVFGSDNHPKQAIVVGAGVVGVCTAYQLARRGYDVAVIEPMSAPGEECSACAAGGMQRSNPVVDKDSWISVAKCLVPHWMRPSRHFDFFHIDWARCLTDPFFLRWVTTFTKTSLWPDEHQESKQADMLDFTDYAVKEMIEMLEKNRGFLGKKSGYNTRGSLAVSYDPLPEIEEDMEDTTAKKLATSSSVIAVRDNTKSKNPTQSKRNLEPSKQIVGTDMVLLEEPSLRFQEQVPTSAKYEYEAKSAHSGRFTKALADICKRRSWSWELNNGGTVQFFYETKVQGITTHDNIPGQVMELKTDKGVILCRRNNKDQTPIPVVVATGAWVPHVLALMDYYAPVYPLTGYAMSVSAKEATQTLTKSDGSKLSNKDLPSRIVCDKYMYTTRLGPDEIRITSIGEFSGWSTKPTPAVDKEFGHEAARQFPQLTPLIPNTKTLCGHRPLVSDGILLLGKLSASSNVYLSCGPGSNGWKLAMGSGEAVARLIEGQPAAEISQHMGANLDTFAPKGRAMHSPLFARICRAIWNV